MNFIKKINKIAHAAPALMALGLLASCASTPSKLDSDAHGNANRATASSFEGDIILVSECRVQKVIDTYDWGAIWGDSSAKYSTFQLSYVMCVRTLSGKKKKLVVKNFDLGFFEDNDTAEVTGNLQRKCESFRADLKNLEISNKSCP